MRPAGAPEGVRLAAWSLVRMMRVGDLYNLLAGLTPLVAVTTDEGFAREQVVDCAVAWSADPSPRNARDLRAAVAILAATDTPAVDQSSGAEYNRTKFTASL